MKFVIGFFLFVLAVAAVAAGVVGWELHQLHEFAATPVTVPAEVVVTIPARTGPHAISDKLASAGVISDAKLLYWNARFIRRVAGEMKEGQYLFKADSAETPDEIIDRLLKGEQLNVKVTIPEGLRIDEQAPIFEAAGLAKAADYVQLAHDKAFIESLGIHADSLEGYLYPDTYLIPKNATTKQILKLMVSHFKKAWTTADAQRLPSVTLSEEEAVTLASIIEKETGNPEERPRISCVFHNRLKKGMKLQTDPTVIYSIILRTGAFDGNIHKSDLETPHPYNTYAVSGLPPGPIANAGLAALEAALAPIECDDLFFVSRNDGTHVFCPTLTCHNENVHKWQIEYFRHHH